MIDLAYLDVPVAARLGAIIAAEGPLGFYELARRTGLKPQQVLRALRNEFDRVPGARWTVRLGHAGREGD